MKRVLNKLRIKCTSFWSICY